MASPLDREFLKRARELEDEVEVLLAELDEELRSEVENSVSAGEVQRQDELEQRASRHIARFITLYSAAVVVANRDVAQAKADRNKNLMLPRLRKSKLYEDARQLERQLDDYAETIEKRFRHRNWAKDGRTFTQRIKTIQRGTEKTVRNIIHNGIQSGQGAKEIARDIQQYVNPTTGRTAPFEEFRKRFGRPKSFRPKDIPSGSVKSNAMRIARTETAHTYRQATVDFYKDKDYVKGWDWVLSGSHPRADECDTYAANSPYKDPGDLPVTHPMCLCDVHANLMSVDELSQLERAEAVAV